MPIEEVIGIDPGPKESGVVCLAMDGIVQWAGMRENHDIRHAFGEQIAERTALVAIEHVVPYSKLSHSLLDTILWIGRFKEARGAGELTLITRHEVKQHLCHRMDSIRDGDVNDAVAHRYGGDRKSAVGTKKAQGLLYGIKGHLWAALAVACVALDRLKGAAAAKGEGKVEP
jgi:hypothetical protein